MSQTMYAFFKGRSSKDTDRDKKTRFFTQREMLQHRNISGGMCSQLSNAWLEERINAREPIFLNDEEQTFQVSVATLERQAKMEERGETDMRHIAFISSNTPHRHVDTPTSNLTTSDGLKKLVGDSRYALFSYPTNENHPPHMVAFENDNGHGECRMFDANRYFGETKGPCSEIQKIFADTVRFRSKEHSKPTHVALSLTP